MSETQVLVVEDERITARNIKNKLEQLGYAVPVVASSGEEAIKRTAEARPDLVLMDIKLKGDMNGIQAAEQIRTRFNIPVIYLTAYADEDTLQRAKITESYSYILKPFQAEELHTNIEMALYKHKMEKKLQESEKRYRMLFTGIYNFLEAEEEGTTMNEVNRRSGFSWRTKFSYWLKKKIDLFRNRVFRKRRPRKVTRFPGR